MPDWVKEIYIKEMLNRFGCKVIVEGKIHAMEKLLQWKSIDGIKVK